MKAIPLLALGLSLTLLQGCVLIPGQRMSEGALEGNHVTLVQITPDTLATENASAANAATIPPELLSFQPETYHIGAGDTLYITVWDHPELTSPAGSQQQTQANGRLVRPDGTLFYPYVGAFKASGMTIEEVRQEISGKLAKFITKPQVDVSVVGYGSQRITFQGAFTRAEPQLTTAVPMTLAQAIGTATINADQADMSDLVLTRDGHDYHIDLNALGNGSSAGQEIYLKSGDRLFLPYNDNKEIYVMGEVVRPQALNFKTSNPNLTQVLGRAGGLNPITSDGKAVYVIRGVKDLKEKPATVFHLNAHSPAAFALADNFRVHPGDVVWVGPAGVTEWNRVLSQLLPLSGIVGNAALTNQRLGR